MICSILPICKIFHVQLSYCSTVFVVLLSLPCSHHMHVLLTAAAFADIRHISIIGTLLYVMDSVFVQL